MFENVGLINVYLKHEPDMGKRTDAIFNNLPMIILQTKICRNIGLDTLLKERIGGRKVLFKITDMKSGTIRILPHPQYIDGQRRMSYYYHIVYE